MGLAVLPARLKNELKGWRMFWSPAATCGGSDTIAKHADWAEELQTRYTFTADNVEGILQDEVGKVFARCWRTQASASAPRGPGGL